MNEEGLGIGASLRAAREAKGWSTQDAGSRLRLMSRQIEAIEADDFSRLGQAVFARGFVRNYAKLLGLNPDELLDRMNIINAPKVEETESVPFTPSQEFWKSPWVLGGIVAVIVAVALPMSLYWWLSSGEEERPAAAVEQQISPPPPPPAPAMDGQQAASPEASATEPAATPDATLPGEQPAAPQPGAPSGSVPQPGTPSGSAPQTGAQLGPVAQATPAAAQSANKLAPAASAIPAPVAAAPSNGLRLQFDDISWVQVRDSSGQIVHSGLNPAGASVDVAGKAPFYLVVGNADKVRVVYKGKLIDIKPFTSVNVARLTLNP